MSFCIGQISQNHRRSILKGLIAFIAGVSIGEDDKLNELQMTTTILEELAAIESTDAAGASPLVREGDDVAVLERKMAGWVVHAWIEEQRAFIDARSGAWRPPIFARSIACWSDGKPIAFMRAVAVRTGEQ